MTKPPTRSRAAATRCLLPSCVCVGELDPRALETEASLEHMLASNVLVCPFAVANPSVQSLSVCSKFLASEGWENQKVPGARCFMCSIARQLDLVETTRFEAPPWRLGCLVWRECRSVIGQAGQNPDLVGVESPCLETAFAKASDKMDNDKAGQTRTARG